MAPLIVLLGVFALVLAVERVRGSAAPAARAGRLALASMFCFTGASHFLFTGAMVEMLPPLVPQRELVVWATGALEILGAAGLLVPATRRLAGWCLLAFLIAVFPANVYAAWNATGMGGHASGPGYLWFRAPLQLFFLTWTAHFGVLGSAPRTRPPSRRRAWATPAAKSTPPLATTTGTLPSASR